MAATGTKSELDVTVELAIKHESLTGEEGVTLHGAQTYQPENHDIDYQTLQTQVEEGHPLVYSLHIKQEQTSCGGEDSVMCTTVKMGDLLGRTSSSHLDDALQIGSGQPVFKVKAEPIVQDTANIPVVWKTETLVADFEGSVSDFHSSLPVPEKRASKEMLFPVALYKRTRISNRLTTAYPCDQDKSRRNIAVDCAASMSSTSHDITSDSATLVSKVNSEKETHQCSLCNYSSVHKWFLVSHMRTHSREKPYKCSICDYRSAKKMNVVVHMNTHTGEKPFMCSVCDKRFAQRSTLATHTRIHTGEKPYKCQVCEYSSSLRRSLNGHMSTHTGEKPYKCSVCEYSSPYKHVLVIHMRTHTGEKPFVCSVCYLRFATNSNLVSHMRIHTRDKPH